MRKKLAVAATAVATALMLAGCASGLKEEYVAALRSAPDANFESIPDEQFLATFDSRCKVLDTFDSADDVRANARTQWDDGVSSQSNATEAEYIANAVAMFLAAQATCG
jgi:PBP1b-binding outer membrane lipoprotein LpoB